MVTTIIIMESSKQQQQSFPFDMGLATAFLDPSSSTNDDIPFELDFLSSSSPLDDITPQQPDLRAPSLTSCFPIEQQQHSPLQDNGQPYCSPSFLFSHLDTNQIEQQQQQQQRPMGSQKEEEDEDEEGTIECYNCKVISTPLWRRTPDRAHILCNACGLYYKQYKRHRPVRIWQRATRWLGIEGYYQNPNQQQLQQQYITTPPMQQQQCANCHQTDTPLWRKNSRGQSICNACGLFFKLHHRDRPMELNKTNSQRRRRRRRDPLSAGTEEMFMGLRADMSRDEMQLVLRIMEERCAFLKAMLGNNNNSSNNDDDRQLPSPPSPPQQQQQQQEIFGYM